MHGQSLSGRSILIVEDHMIIALDLASAFEDAGAVVATATNLADAMRMAEQDDLSAAVVDFGLGQEDAEPLFGRLNARNIMFVLHSGYGNQGVAGNRGMVIPKPADPAILVAAIAGALRLKDASVSALQSHPHVAAFPPARLNEIRQAFEDGWPVIAAGFARDEVEAAASRFATILFDVAGDDRIDGANLTLTAINEMQKRETARDDGAEGAPADGDRARGVT